MDWLQTASLILLGGFVGVLVGMSGLGGYLVTPALITAFSVAPTTAVALSLETSLIIGVIGGWVHWQSQTVLLGPLGWLLLGGIAGAVGGYATATHLTVSGLESVLAVVLLLTALWLLFSSGTHTVKQTNPTKIARYETAWLVGTGGVAGFMAGLTGIGGPMIVVPLLLVMGLETRQAIGTSLVYSIVVTAVGVLLYKTTALQGSEWSIGLLPGAAVGAWAGARLVHIIPGSFLRRLIAGLALVSSLILWP